MIRCAAALALGAGLLALPRGTAAQCLPGPPGVERECRLDTPGWVGHLTTFSANAFLGGLTAAVTQRIRGGSAVRGFTNGVVGGGVTAVGKWVAAQRFSGAGLLGRELSAAGTSIVRNAADGEPMLSELVLPLGPVRMYVQRGDRTRIAAKLDLVATGWLVYGVVEPELELDLGESISSGTPVFFTDDRILLLGDDSAHAAGLANAGVIFLADVPAYGAAFRRHALAHERVHVLQEDQLFALWTDQAEDWLLGRLPGGERAARYIDINVSTELLRLLGGLFDGHDRRPWELESFFLAR